MGVDQRLEVAFELLLGQRVGRGIEVITTPSHGAGVNIDSGGCFPLALKRAN